MYESDNQKDTKIIGLKKTFYLTLSPIPDPGDVKGNSSSIKLISIREARLEKIMKETFIIFFIKIILSGNRSDIFMEATHNFIQFLQACITPVALISGVGLLLLTITNRLGRTIDRTRILTGELDRGNVLKREIKINEVRILHKRSIYLRSSIAAIVVSVIFSSLIIPLLFMMILFGWNLKTFGYIFFVLSILAIFASSIYFFMDIILTLKAIKLEAGEYLNE